MLDKKRCLKIKNRELVKRAQFQVLQKSSTLPRVVWVEESKNSRGFEIGPSYDNVPMTSQCATVLESSCCIFLEKVL